MLMLGSGISTRWGCQLLGGEEAQAHDFAKSPQNCMKLKEFGPCWGGGVTCHLFQNFTM